MSGGVSIAELKSRLCAELARNGVENARFEAEQLLMKCGISRNSLLSEPRESVPPDVETRVSELLERRLGGYPLQYLIGDWDFYGCSFKIGEGVLIPRQDTECLAELADGFLKKRSSDKRRVLDLCAGSGCIGIALAKRLNARVVCVEKSEAAFKYLLENIELNGVKALVSAVGADIFGDIPELDGEYDVIVSNPPYLTAEEMKSLQREVTFEPKSALYGGDDGLDFYRLIPKKYLPMLARGGLLAVEIGYLQAVAVAAIFKENGAEPLIRKDMCGNDRIVYCIK